MMLPGGIFQEGFSRRLKKKFQKYQKTIKKQTNKKPSYVVASHIFLDLSESCQLNVLNFIIDEYYLY